MPVNRCPFDTKLERERDGAETVIWMSSDPDVIPDIKSKIVMQRKFP